MKRFTSIILLSLVYGICARAQPVISSLNPTIDSPGTSVTITGTNFNASAGNNIVYFGATIATVTSATSTSLSVNVPIGATYMPVSVTDITTGLTGFSQFPFLPTFNNNSYEHDTILFDANINLAADNNPYSIAIGDIDGDGKPDIVVVNSSSYTLSVYKNISTSGTITSGSFAPKVDFACPSGGSIYQSVLLADIDGDGKLDIVTRDYHTISVFRNISSTGVIDSNSFASRIDLGSGGDGGAPSLAINDLDGDGKPDIAVVNFGSVVSVFQNTSSPGTISFNANVDYTTGSSANNVVIGDIDGDGKPDLIVANYYSNSISVLQNTSAPGSITSSSFAAKVDFATSFGHPGSVLLGDIDGDGKTDIIEVNNGNVAFLRNTSVIGTITSSSLTAGSNTISTTVDYTVGSSVNGVVLGDMDGDGKPDLIVVNQTGNTITAYRNIVTSPGTIDASSFSGPANLAATSPYTLVIGDMDGDGKPDIVTANGGYNDLSNTVSVLRNHPMPTTLGGITGTTTVCVGSTTALTNTTVGGTWSSGSTGIATVGSSTGIVTGVAAGTAVISYTHSGSRVTTVVTVNPSPVAITGTANVCTGLTITLTDATTGGTWSTASSNASVGTGAGIITGVNAGTAIISYTLPAGCRKTITVTVNQSPAAISGNSGILCATSTMALSDAITGGTWASSSTSVATVATTGVVTGVAGGSTTISYTLGSCRATIIVTAGALPAAISGTVSVCTGLTTTLTDVTAGGTWSSTSANVSIGSGAGVTTGISAGTAIITYTLPTGCLKTTTVTVNQSPAAISGNSGILCATSTMALSDAITGGIWASSSTAVATIATTGVVTGVAGGTTTISYTLPGSCRATTIVTAGALPAAISGTASVCTGLTTTLTDATAGGTWSTASGNVNVGPSVGITTGISAGTAVITYTLPTGCIKTVTVTVNQSPAAISGNSGILCATSTMALSDAIAGGTWASSSTAVATIATTGVVTGVAGGTTTISYTLPGSCRATTIVTAGALPAAISGTASVCTGLTTTLTDATTGGTWSTASSNVSVGPSVGITTGISAGTAVITYTLPTGCMKTVTVTVNQSPATITAGAGSVCIGATITYSDAISGGTWASSTMTVATIASTGTVTGVAAGTSTISYTLADGCRSTAVVAVNANPLAISGTASVCSGSTINLSDATAGGNWSINNTAIATINSSTGSVTGVAAGNTTVSYILSTGCYKTVLVTVNPLPDAGILTGPSIVAAGATITLTDGALGGTLSSSNTAIAMVNSGGLVTGVTVGTANISYTVTNGCGTAHSIVSVTVTPGLGRTDNTTGVAVAGLTKDEWSAYPNPTSGVLTIKTETQGVFYLFSIDGKQTGVYRISETSNFIKLPEGLAPGMYLGRYITDDGRTEDVKLLYKP